MFEYKINPENQKNNPEDYFGCIFGVRFAENPSKGRYFVEESGRGG